MDYHFNPQTNIQFALDEANTLFVDTASADFRLAENSHLKGAGTQIE